MNVETNRVSARFKSKFGPRRLSAPLPLMPVLPLGFLKTEKIQIRHQNLKVIHRVIRCFVLLIRSESYLYLSKSSGSDLQEHQKEHQRSFTRLFLCSRLKECRWRWTWLEQQTRPRGPSHRCRKGERVCICQSWPERGSRWTQTICLTHPIITGAGNIPPTGPSPPARGNGWLCCLGS